MTRSSLPSRRKASLVLGGLLAAAGAIAITPAALPLAPLALAQEKPAPAPLATKKTAEASLQRAYAWLVTQQHENGSFGKIPGADEKQGEAGMSALVLRAMAKAPASVRGDLEASMQKVAKYLVSLQQADGGIANPGAGLTTYRTSIAIMALHAYDARAYADAIAKGQGFLVRGQWSEDNGLSKKADEAKASPYYGGWGYDKTGTKPEADMSNTHFVLEALRETGLTPDSAVWKRAVTFLQRCQNRSETNDLRPEGITIADDGGFMYDPAIATGKSDPVKLPDGTFSIPSYASITYAGLMSLLHANVSKEDPRVKGARAWIEKNYTLEENRGLGSRTNPQNAKQGLFYYYQAFAKALVAWGEPTLKTADGVEHRWAEELTKHLAGLQKPEGFWVNEVKRWWEDDPVLCTAYTGIALGEAYKFLPEGTGR